MIHCALAGPNGNGEGEMFVPASPTECGANGSRAQHKGDSDTKDAVHFSGNVLPGEEDIS